MSLSSDVTIENAPLYLGKWLDEAQIEMYKTLSPEKKWHILKEIEITNYNKALKKFADMIASNQYKSLAAFQRDPENPLDYVISGS